MTLSRQRFVHLVLAFLLPALAGCDLFKKESSTGPSSSTPPKSVTLAGGSGFIFEGAAKSVDDRDIWWNAASIVPAHDSLAFVKMAPLGPVADLSSVNDLKIAAMTFDQQIPKAGDAFALEIRRPFDSQQPRYALIRVASLTNELTLEYIYPR